MGESRGRVQSSNEIEFILVVDFRCLAKDKDFLREECLELHPGMVGTKLQNPF